MRRLASSAGIEGDTCRNEASTLVSDLKAATAVLDGMNASAAAGLSMRRPFSLASQIVLGNVPGNADGHNREKATGCIHLPPLADDISQLHRPTEPRPASSGKERSSQRSASSCSRSEGKECARVPGFDFLDLALELRLRIALMLGWHGCISFWHMIHRYCDAASSIAWRELVSALVGHTGHNSAFLTDLSVLRAVPTYQPFIAAYRELYPDMMGKFLSLRYNASRTLGTVIALNDLSTMRLFLHHTPGPILIDACLVCTAMERRSTRCAEMLLKCALAESPWQSAKVGLEYPKRSCLANRLPTSGYVDFDVFPQRLLWAAAKTRHRGLCDAVIRLIGGTGTGSNMRSGGAARGSNSFVAAGIQFWMVCCAVACGYASLLEHVSPSELCTTHARVSFRCPSSLGSPEAEFVETPLSVVAAVRGHADVLRKLVQLGFDGFLCSRRGLTALDAIRRHRSAEVRTELTKAIQLAMPAALVGSILGGCVPFDAHAVDDPFTAAIERADLATVGLLLNKGAVLETSDLLAAVGSGDLDVLAFVKSECQKMPGGAKRLRELTHEAAMRIRAPGTGHVQEGILSRRSPAPSLVHKQGSHSGI